ncbi:OmpA family protein [Rhodopila sp.]|uniref:OmpA family protein n=1 Tax=Rhodopila sp. TaxID=2480087 RepID=UPI003D0ABED3
MPRQTSWAVVPAWLTMMTVTLLAAGCSVPSGAPIYAPLAAPQAQLSDPQLDSRFARLASQLAMLMPGTDMVSVAPGTCGPAAAPVVHLVVPEPVLFATASDQPGPDAAGAIDHIAALTEREVPGAAMTVLGHTDSVGSDAYNIDLSQRRAVTVLHALVSRGLDPNHLTAIAIGKRQPIADNLTTEGRARNRRVEFLVSRCLAANLAVAAAAPRERGLLAPENAANQPVEVMRLDPAGAYGMVRLTEVSLRSPEADRLQPVALRVSAPARPSALSPPVALARPAPAPHYQPRTLSPEVQRNPLGPAVPF